MQNIYYYTILGISLFFFIFDKILEYLNTLNWSEKLPKELEGIYEEEKYKQAQKYDKAKFIFNNISSSFSFIITFLFLFFGFFGKLDIFLRNYFNNELFVCFGFFGIIFLAQTIVTIPFSYYYNFVLEEKFGFNKMNIKTFILDIFKSIFLSFFIGGILIGIIFYIFKFFGDNFWIYAWIFLSLFSLFIMTFYTSFIVPIFNKLNVLEDGELKNEIQKFGKKVGFELNNIFVLDGSKRSSKANAYFSGFGPKKTIVLYDTLIQKLSSSEIIAVLAHEIGHYKKKHTLQMLLFSILQTGIILFLFSKVVNNTQIAISLGANISSFHIGAFAFGILFTPISLFLGIFGNILSRKNEFEADNFAKINYSGEELSKGLKKLSIDSLSNMQPHYLYEFVHYSHPTVLKRIKKL